jgi:hypothetical protein
MTNFNMEVKDPETIREYIRRYYVKFYYWIIYKSRPLRNFFDWKIGWEKVDFSGIDLKQDHSVLFSKGTIEIPELFSSLISYLDDNNDIDQIKK